MIPGNVFDYVVSNEPAVDPENAVSYPALEPPSNISLKDVIRETRMECIRTSECFN